MLGGLHGHDGWVTSAGMFGLRRPGGALPDVTVTTYGWPSYKQVAADIARLPKDDIVIVLGYSGGGAKATWLANMPSKPHIDLMIMYEPSPSWGMMPIGPNVKRAICYCNVTPAFFGLGGGMLRGRDNTNVEIVKIYEQHMLVQVNQTLHAAHDRRGEEGHQGQRPAGSSPRCGIANSSRLVRAFSTRTESSVVMAGLVPAIHALLCSQGVDARDKRGHDVEGLHTRIGVVSESKRFS